ncbi:MAG: TraR/DksA family transcriptional regulator [Myxococcales bacterium]|nr:TraR/DksA family transcriptional regulator [Myxococcales bacterium]
MDDLTDAQIQELAAALERLKEELEAALSSARGAAEVVSLDQPIGRVSRMDALQQQEMAQASRRQIELRLGQVAVALDAVARGEYGECRSCGEPIGVRRLAARPETPFCLTCQGGRERG